MPHFGVRICYRSVFDDRWLLDITKLVGASQWREVEACPAPSSEGSPGF